MHWAVVYWVGYGNARSCPMGDRTVPDLINNVSPLFLSSDGETRAKERKKRTKSPALKKQTNTSSLVGIREKGVERRGRQEGKDKKKRCEPLPHRRSRLGGPSTRSPKTVWRCLGRLLTGSGGVRTQLGHWLDGSDAVQRPIMRPRGASRTRRQPSPLPPYYFDISASPCKAQV